MTDPLVCSICKERQAKIFDRTTVLCQHCAHAIERLAQRLCEEVRVIRLQRVGEPVTRGGGVDFWDTRMTADDQQPWRDCALAIMRLGDQLLESGDDGGAASEDQRGSQGGGGVGSSPPEGGRNTV